MSDNDYTRLVTGLQDAINEVESVDTVDPDIEGLVIESISKLETAKELAEARAEEDDE